MLTAMLVDDHTSFRKLIRDELLSYFPSLRVIEASCGEEVFKGLAASPFDLVLMDIRLGAENGLTLTRAIKANYKDSAVLVLSGFDLPEYREAAAQYGANSFIVKGTDNVVEKIAAVLKCFQRAKARGSPPPGCLSFSQPG